MVPVDGEGHRRFPGGGKTQKAHLNPYVLERLGQKASPDLSSFNKNGIFEKLFG